MIDVVITYVDSSDKHWQNEYEKYVKRPLKEVVNRYRSYGVLDLQIECIRKFMPFVHRIFVVVSSRTQVPKSLLEMKDVVIVTHSDIIPKTYLPCFNSCVIEMFLCKIKGLSERFLYFNDDVFPINKCKPEDFFVDDKICMNYEFKNYDEENASIFQHNVINSTKIFYKENELSFNGIKPMHSVMPMLKSVCSVVLTENLKAIMLSLTRTRHSKNFNAYLFLNYMFKEHRFKPSTLKYEYTELGVELINIEKDTQLLCVNDNGYCYDFEIYCQELKKFFKCLLSGKPYKILIKEEHKEDNKQIVPFSICISAYKAKDFIKECLDSIENQTYFKDNDKYEILLGIDGCNETLNYVKTIQNNYKNLKVYMMDSNKGTYITSNTLMNNIAKYDWLVRFDADDIMNENFIKELVKAINKTDNIYFFRYLCQNFNDDTKEIYKTVKSTGSICINKNVFKELGGYRPWICAADSELLERIRSISKYLINKPLFKRRIHQNNLTVNNETNYKSNIRKQYEEFINNERITKFSDAIINCETNSYKRIISDDIIVSFTTWKQRDMYVEEMLTWFTKQTVKPSKIICWLAKDEYNGVIPDSLIKCLNKGLLDDIKWTEKNIYGHKRYEVFKQYSNAYVILIDDDIYYPIDYVELLYNYCKENENNVICYYSRSEMYGKNGVRSFTDVNSEPSYENRYFSGLAAFPPNTFPIESFNYTYLRDKYCFKCDDSWVNGWLFKKNIKVKAIYNWGKKSPLKVISNTQELGIYETHNGLKINGVMQAAINIANAVVLTHTEYIAKRIWPDFNIYDITTCIERI